MGLPRHTRLAQKGGYTLKTQLRPMCGTCLRFVVHPRGQKDTCILSLPQAHFALFSSAAETPGVGPSERLTGLARGSSLSYVGFGLSPFKPKDAAPCFVAYCVSRLKHLPQRKQNHLNNGSGRRKTKGQLRYSLGYDTLVMALFGRRSADMVHQSFKYATSVHV